jgi:chromate reductase
MDGHGKLRILAISGSLRKKSYNTAALEALRELSPPDFEIVAHSLRGIPMFDQDEYEAGGFPPPVVALLEAVDRADGIVIASPEFNHSVSGALKNAIDWLSRKKPVPLVDKPVAIVSAATSPNGGIRGQYALRLILQPLEAQALLMPEVVIGRAQDKVDADGRLADEATRTALAAQMTAFRRWILRLRPVPATA